MSLEVEVEEDREDIDNYNESSFSISEKMKIIQLDYYEKNGKNLFFKNSQKQNCAELVCSKMNLGDLLNETIWIIPNTNGVFIDYTVFKMYATPENYDLILNHIISKFTECIEEFGEYNVYMNILGFTISSGERYKPIIDLFYRKCFEQTQTVYFTNALNNMKILNAPAVMEQISSLFNSMVSPQVKTKIQIYKKENSSEVINYIMNMK